MQSISEQEPTQLGAEASAAESQAAPGTALSGGVAVGRYIVLGRVGAGGMGIVYAAYDPELDRKVAIKLLRAGTRDEEEARARLLREAQALARVSHPNIVAIHDVGTVGDEVWLAMELVAGTTLREWTRQRTRSWREVLEVAVGAGRGLAAAHAAGLVHRDVKPDNIMVGDDRRVRVMDFGLARSDAPTSIGDGEAPQSEAVDDSTLASRLTRAGSRLGTPAYMAPEQHADRPTTARSDQFAFAVTLWEALYGSRPFSGASLAELATNVLEGRVREPTRTDVPRWVRRILMRALAHDPDARWPGVEDMMSALARGHQRARRQVVLAALAGVGVVGAGVVGARALATRAAVRDCEAAGASITSVWNEDARASVRDALVGTGIARASVTAEKVMPWLDEHARAWNEARAGACVAAEVRHDWSADVLARSLWCLDDRRTELAALVEQLARGEARAVDTAVPAAAGLTPIDPCGDEVFLARQADPPADRLAEVVLVREQLSRASALRHTGAFAEGVAVARAASERAQVLAWPPLVASAQARLGSLLHASGDYPGAEQAFTAAYFAAASAGAADIAASAADHLVVTVGHARARYDDAELWSRHAAVMLAAAPDPARLREADHLRALGNLYADKGDHAQAEALLTDALAILEPALGSEHPDVARALNDLAIVHENKGELDRAAELYERALAIRVATLGREHLDVATSLNNLGNVHGARGRFLEARDPHARALAIRETVLPPDHPDIAQSLNNFANVEWALGARDDARAKYEAATKIWEKALGPEHPDVAASLNNLGRILRQMGELDEAQQKHERALAIREKVLGGDHRAVAQSLRNLALVHEDRRDSAKARALLERALTIEERSAATDPATVADLLVALGRIAIADARLDDASSAASRAITLLEHDADSTTLASARFVLARALGSHPDERARATRLAEQARDRYRRSDAYADELAAVNAWLAEHQR